MRRFYATGSSFPDLTGDGKITKADILKGRGVFKKGGSASEYHTTKDGRKARKGLWYNIMMKRKRGAKMRKKGEKGAPTQAAIKKSQA
jgi:hypothetical protein